MSENESNFEKEPPYEKIAPIYQIAFAGDPWYEVSKCADEEQRCTGGLSPLAIGEMCEVCGNCPSQPAYETDELIEHFKYLWATRPTAWYTEQNDGEITLAAVAWKATPSTIAEEKYSDVPLMRDWLEETLGDREVMWLDEVFANRNLKPKGNLKNFGKFVMKLAEILETDKVAYRTIEPRMLAAAKRDFGLNASVTLRDKELPDRRDFVAINPKGQQMEDFDFKRFGDIDSETQEYVASLISSYTNGELGEKPQMLPVSPKDIYEKYVGFAAFSKNIFAGYIGATEPEQFNGNLMSEVGSLWVPKEFRKQGLGHKLVSLISNELVLNNIAMYAFCNLLSKPIYQETGYKNASADEVPVTAFDSCANCPANPGDGSCCDELLIYK